MSIGVPISLDVLCEPWPVDAPCPAHTDGKCVYLGTDQRCSTFICTSCKERVPDCFGCDDDKADLCDDCWQKFESYIATSYGI